MVAMSPRRAQEDTDTGVVYGIRDATAMSIQVPLGQNTLHLWALRLTVTTRKHKKCQSMEYLVLGEDDQTAALCSVGTPALATDICIERAVRREQPREIAKCYKYEPHDFKTTCPRDWVSASKISELRRYSMQ